MLIDDLFSSVRRNGSDISEHVELLARLSSICDQVTEFGVRDGNSTVALVYGRPRCVRSYDVAACPRLNQLERAAVEASVRFEFRLENVLETRIELTDLLFIDTLHTYRQLSAELRLHADRVGKYIALHDTTTFGDADEIGPAEGGSEAGAWRQGLWPAVSEFLTSKRSWALKFYFTNNNGLTVLERVRT